jgi:hypothetical protein
MFLRIGRAIGSEFLDRCSPRLEYLRTRMDPNVLIVPCSVRIRAQFSGMVPFGDGITLEPVGHRICSNLQKEVSMIAAF